MEDLEHKSKHRGKQVGCLFIIAAVFGFLSTARAFGIGGVTLPAVGLLGAASAVALPALLLTFRKGGLNRENKRVIIIFLFGVHLIATLFFFPPEDIVNDRPVLTLDHAVHYYQIVRARSVLWDSFRLYAYDPYFMAGHPGGTIFDVDTKGAELFCSILLFLSAARAFKLFVLLAHLMMVFTVYGGCRRLGYRFEESVFAVCLLLAYWHWGRPYAGDFRYAGMFAFIFVTHLSLYIVGLFEGFLEGRRSVRFFVLGPLAFFIHPTAAVLLPAPFLALFFLKRRLVISGSDHHAWGKMILLRLVAWCALIIGVNLIWLVPMFRYMDIKLPSEAFFQLGGFGELASLILKPGNLPAIMLMVLSAVGFYRLVKDRRLTEAIAPAAGAVFLLFLSCLGVYLPGINQLEPGRFLFSAFIFLVPLAAVGFMAILNLLERFLRSPRLIVSMKTAALVVLFLCPAPLALLEARSHYKHTVSTTLIPEVEALIDAIRMHTSSSGRIMVEDGPARTYGESLLPSILPLLTGVEQIGGPYPFTFIEHHFTTFQLDKTMGKPLEQLNSEELLSYMELYNVQWVVTATPRAKAFFQELEPLELIWSSRHFMMWKVALDWTYASKRGVSVRAAYNHLHVTITPEAGHPPPDSVLIKYHWDRGLKTEPPARISPVLRLKDPVPLILLEPHNKTDIHITYK